MNDQSVETVVQIATLLAFAMALLLVNLKAGTTWLKFITLLAMIAAFAGAGYLVIEWVFL